MKKNRFIVSLLPSTLLFAHPDAPGCWNARGWPTRPNDPTKTRPINCGSTDVGLKGVDRGLKGLEWDVIHFNWGVHDLCYRNTNVTHICGSRDKVGGAISVPLDRYKNNLEQLVQKVPALPGMCILRNQVHGKSPRRLRIKSYRV